MLINFLSLNFSDFNFFLCKNCTPPLKKVTPSFPATPNTPLKVEVLSRPPFLNIWLEAQLPPPHAESGGAHYGHRKWVVNFNARKTQLVSFDQSNNIGAIDDLTFFLLLKLAPTKLVP